MSAQQAAVGFPGRPPRRRVRWVVSGVAVVATAGVVALVLVRPFGASGHSGGGDAATTSQTALATVARRTLSSQTQVSGTLGYAGSATIALPAGTAPGDVQHAEQEVASTEAALQAAEASRAADAQALAKARAQLAADRSKLATDCAGDAAAGADSSASGSSPASSTPCASASQAVATDQQAVTPAEQKVLVDEGSLAAARLASSAASQSLSTARSTAVAYGAGAIFTRLPAPGSVVRRGGSLYAIGNMPTILLYGALPAWRAFRAGMSPGRDVAELNLNLRALGYRGAPAGRTFTAATADAIGAMQVARGLARTGELPLGSVVFRDGAVRVKQVTPTLGSAAQAGPVLSVSSTRHQITVALDASVQDQVKAGDRVAVTLPDTSTAAGVVASVGRVATAASRDGGGGPTVDVQIRLTDQARAGHLDQAPVEVSISTATVPHALVVPVNGLLALAGGGYGVEAVDASGLHRIVAVQLGLFDDAAGLVQVTGSGLRVGQRIVVPAS